MKNQNIIYDENVSLAIYPYGKMGKNVYKSIKQYRLNSNDILVDNYNTDDKIVSFNDVKNKSDYYWLLSTVNIPIYLELKKELLKEKVPKNKIIDILGTEEKYKNVAIKGYELQEKYKNIIKKIKKRINKNIRFGMYIAYSEENGANELINLMKLTPKKWSYKIVVIPDISRSTDYMVNRYKKTKRDMINQYGVDNILDGYDVDRDEYVDYSDFFDIVYCVSPYDSMLHRYHRISFLAEREVLPIHIVYGFEGAKTPLMSRVLSDECSYLWKYFTDTYCTKTIWNKLQPIHGENVFVTGYSKMDTLAMTKSSCDKKKKLRVLIASHHSVGMKDFPLSSFHCYYNKILELPELFPDIEFVFRPHPLLFDNMVKNGYWREEDVEKYINALNSRGISYSVENDYFHLFVECDAIVHDCGSYTEEWLFTGKPGCFIKNRLFDEKYMTQLMLKALKEYVIAYDFDDVIKFVKDLEENDCMVKFSTWTKDELMINYPNSSKKILEEIDVYQCEV